VTELGHVDERLRGETPQESLSLNFDKAARRRSAK
jgi:hypothetical protein